VRQTAHGSRPTVAVLTGAEPPREHVDRLEAANFRTVWRVSEPRLVSRDGSKGALPVRAHAKRRNGREENSSLTGLHAF
jgi:hypothetical protein